jgi:hypothetical protein
MDHRNRRSFVGLIFIVPLLVACFAVPAAAPNDVDGEKRLAEAALARWATLIKDTGHGPAFVPVGELTGQIGDWEAEVGENNKVALMAGAIEAGTSLPSESPGSQDIRWADGTVRTVRAVSAAQALLEARAGSSGCTGCAPLRVTAAKLSTASIQTSRGTAVAPAWEFAIVGTKVRMTRIAVAASDRVTVVPPPWDANNPPTGISIESASGSVGGTELTVTFTGAPDPADKPCGADYAAEAVESAVAVVVIVISHENRTSLGCTLVGARRTAIAALAEPLGERVVLEVRGGLPVSMTLTP